MTCEISGAEPKLIRLDRSLGTGSAALICALLIKKRGERMKMVKELKIELTANEAEKIITEHIEKQMLTQGG